MTETALYAALRTDLKAFTEKAFQTVDPGTVFLDNWHIDAICHSLMTCYEGEIRRLIITQPPRSMKSICASVAFVAWALGTDPALKVICVSYSNDLATELARQCKMVMESGWYQALFTGTRLSKSSENELITTKGGGRLATSIGGTLTGKGADIIIVDDPLKAEDGQSEAARSNVIKWYRGTLSTRLNDKKSGRIILTMQRLHEEDLAGHLTESGGFEHLDLPATAIEDQSIEIGPGVFHHRKTGDVLHREREGPLELAKAKSDLGPLGYSAQYQQRPIPTEGNLFKRDWIKTYSAIPGQPRPIVVQSWDTAVTAGQTSDYSVCVTALLIGSSLYVLDVFRQQLAYPDLRRKVIELANKFEAQMLLIEKAGTGHSLCDEFIAQPPLGVPRPVGITPDRDKVSRAIASLILIERGDLFVPAGAHWLGDFLTELLAFPNAKHDDQVDALSQLINWAENHRRRLQQLGGIGPLGIVPAGEIIQVHNPHSAWDD